MAIRDEYTLEPKTRPFKTLVVAIIAIIVALCIYFYFKKSVASAKTLDNFSYKTLEGQTWTLAEHRGKVVLINAWASWCGPCRGELPDLANVAAKYGTKVDFVGIAADPRDNLKEVQKLSDQFHLPYPTLESTDKPALPHIQYFPTTIILGRDGKIVQYVQHALSEQELSAMLDDALAAS